jgi:hypothetical protein
LFSITSGWVPWLDGRAGRSARVTPPWAAEPPPALELADDDADSEEDADDDADSEEDAEDEADSDEAELVAAEELAAEDEGALLLELALSELLLHAVVTRAIRPTAAAATVVLRRMEETFLGGSGGRAD